VDGDLLRIPIAEAARRLGCSVKTLKRRGAEGRLRS
jgi:DNA-directed RNA polymerase specialized sigma24 family protein